jgi:hypothetical protein
MRGVAALAIALALGLSVVSVGRAQTGGTETETETETGTGTETGNGTETGTGTGTGTGTPGAAEADGEALTEVRSAEVATRARITPDDEELFEVRTGSAAATAFGVLTVVAAVGTVASVAVLLERSNSADVCDGYALEDPVTRGCVNGPAIAEQRDVSVGLLIGLGAATVIGAAGWIIATLMAPSEPSEPTAPAAGLRCAPGGAGLRCTF